MSEINPQFKIAASYSINAAVARMRKRGLSSNDLELNICKSMLNSINKANEAESIYDLFVSNNTGINNIVGLGPSSSFESIESAIENSYINSYSSPAKEVYGSLITSSLMGGYAGGLSLIEMSGFLDSALSQMNRFISGPPPHCFTSQQLVSLINYDYSGSIKEISTNTPKTEATENVFFSYYDLSPSFLTDFNLSKAKDSTIQSYQVSGELIYSEKPWENVEECSEIEIPIFPTDNPTVISRYAYVRPHTRPCIEKYGNICPITGQDFHRVFNDGPYSSGTWSESNIQNLFHSRDKSLISERSYGSNVLELSSFDGIAMLGINGWSVATDLSEGEMSRAFRREISQQPTGGSFIEQHVGNYDSERVGYSLSGIGRYLPPAVPIAFEIYETKTGNGGIKLIPLKLKQKYWSGVMEGIVSNPALESGRIYNLALNFNPSHILDLNNSIQQSGIAGPPQRTNESDFPYIAIEENFQSETAGRYAGLKIGFGLSATEVIGFNQTVFLALEPRTGFSGEFVDPNSYFADEKNQAYVPFELKVGTNQISNTGDRASLIRSFALGMGNSIDGATLSNYSIYNCGYTHSGYLFQGGLVPFDTGNSMKLGNNLIVDGYSALPNFSWGKCVSEDYGSLNSNGAVFGSKEVEDSMLVGWAHNDFGEIPISKLYAYNGNKEYTYSGFDSGLSLSIADEEHFPKIGPENGFAKNPYFNELLSSGWFPIIRKQKRENGFPRYFRGPFASAKKRFLYPNASRMANNELSFYNTNGLLSITNKGQNKIYNRSGQESLIPEYSDSGIANQFGFPHKVVFNITVKQYVKKELYLRDEYDKFGEINRYLYLGINPEINKMEFDELNSFSEANAVDEDYASPSMPMVGNMFIMPNNSKNPCIYNSKPNFVQGFLSNEVGLFSGSRDNVTVGIEKPLPRDESYIVGWSVLERRGIFGPEYSPIKLKNPEGYFSYNKEFTVKVTGYYTPPGFSLERSAYNPEPIHNTFPVSKLFWENNYGGRDYLYGREGTDPLYFKRIGNFSGITDNYRADEGLNGGLHPSGPNGLVGDSWMGFHSGREVISGQEYGYGTYQVNDPAGRVYMRRSPNTDRRAFIVDLKTSGIGLHFSALDYFPGYNEDRKSSASFVDGTGYFRSGIYFKSEGDFNFLNKTYSYTGKMESGKLYQIPSGRDWDMSSGSLSSTDWQINHTGTIYHWRQQAKMDVSISNIEWSNRGDCPYDIENLVMPTGECSVVGKMEYLTIEESPVFSEGIFLTDVSKKDNVRDNSFYPQFLSDVMREHSYPLSIPLNSEIQPAPSRQYEFQSSGGKYLLRELSSPTNTNEKHYNKYIVGAISDYAYLNDGVLPSYDGKPIANGQLMPHSTMLYSASQGQELPDGSVNPNIKKLYLVTDQIQFYDSEMTDSSLDPRFTDKNRPVWEYKQTENGTLIPKTITWTEYERGLF